MHAKPVVLLNAHPEFPINSDNLYGLPRFKVSIFGTEAHKSKHRESGVCDSPQQLH